MKIDEVHEDATKDDEEFNNSTLTKIGIIIGYSIMMLLVFMLLTSIVCHICNIFTTVVDTIGFIILVSGFLIFFTGFISIFFTSKNYDDYISDILWFGGIFLVHLGVAIVEPPIIIIYIIVYGAAYFFDIITDG